MKCIVVLMKLNLIVCVVVLLNFYLLILEHSNLDIVFLDLDYIGYMQIDSTYIFIDKSAKSCVRKIKGHDKAFNIKERIYDLPFFVDPAIIVDIPK